MAQALAIQTAMPRYLKAPQWSPRPINKGLQGLHSQIVRAQSPRLYLVTPSRPFGPCFEALSEKALSDENGRKFQSKLGGESRLQEVALANT